MNHNGFWNEVKNDPWLLVKVIVILIVPIAIGISGGYIIYIGLYMAPDTASILTLLFGVLVEIWVVSVLIKLRRDW